MDIYKRVKVLVSFISLAVMVFVNLFSLVALRVISLIISLLLLLIIRAVSIVLSHLYLNRHVIAGTNQ